MPNESLIVSFALEPEESVVASADCPTVLEQVPWTGTYVSKVNLVEAIANFIEGSENTEIWCATDSGTYLSTLLVHTASLDVGSVGVTRGNVGTAIVQQVEITERVEFSMSLSQDTKYPIKILKTYNWIGDVWDSEGATVFPPPTIDVLGSTVIVSSEVVGVVEVVYDTVRETRTLSVDPRETTVGGSYDSVVWVVKDCGVEILVLDPPPTAESNWADGVNCWGGAGDAGGDTDIIPSDDDDAPTAEPKDIDINIDYCTQKVIE